VSYTIGGSSGGGGVFCGFVWIFCFFYSFGGSGGGCGGGGGGGGGSANETRVTVSSPFLLSGAETGAISIMKISTCTVMAAAFAATRGALILFCCSYLEFKSVMWRRLC